VVSPLGIKVETLSLIFLAVSLVAGLAASYLLIKNGQTINTALKRGAKILFYTHVVGLFFMLVLGFALLGITFTPMFTILGFEFWLA